ncbi:putative DNA modification/repair radical SAM protein [Algimonas porphyrae]|uniref:DNA modification/repair radical SAM protein n=1 Tax=Algimonas porphyrae TaxID=1128113 RepID=A0ABQ5V0S1_9PROT|nr:putative DNA modification/repair radical SAM protein [Algimonas porphyrae]GLQ21150.1 putative DNA modification/repair radical SAM protein [Algimonas porphyrae]
MAARSLIDKLAILADAAKYDASCASSGTATRSSMGQNGPKQGLGSTEGMGICHAYAPDGRCISLLKVLLTNFCIFDCRYCVNRVSSNVDRARFSVSEVVQLTLDFYKRNYIEGLFLSSGIIQSPDYTMEQIVDVARTLREEHQFRGYIHLKTIPEADPLLIARAGELADRVSINVELPKESSLEHFAPEKSQPVIRKAMAGVKLRLDDARDAQANRLIRKAKPPVFAPGGQSTQMIIGADASTDTDILKTSTELYSGYGLRRVYYSAFSPMQDASLDLPPVKPPLMREHRLYQADWLLRFYQFERSEIDASTTNGMLDLDIDPKLAWALRHRSQFPIDVNRAPRHLLLRIPGLGAKTVDRLIEARRMTSIRLADLIKLTKTAKKAMPFIQTADYQPGGLLDTDNLRARFAPPPEQLALAV